MGWRFQRLDSQKHWGHLRIEKPHAETSNRLHRWGFPRILHWYRQGVWERSTS